MADFGSAAQWPWPSVQKPHVGKGASDSLHSMTGNKWSRHTPQSGHAYTSAIPFTHLHPLKAHEFKGLVVVTAMRQQLLQQLGQLDGAVLVGPWGRPRGWRGEHSARARRSYTRVSTAPVRKPGGCAHLHGCEAGQPNSTACCCEGASHAHAHLGRFMSRSSRITRPASGRSARPVAVVTGLPQIWRVRGGVRCVLECAGLKTLTLHTHTRRARAKNIHTHGIRPRVRPPAGACR